MPQNNQQDPSFEQRVEISKKDLIERKRKKFVKRMRLLALGLVILVIVTIFLRSAIKTYYKIRQDYILENEIETEIVINETETVEEPITEEKFYSEKYGFSFEYWPSDSLVLIDEPDREFSASVISEEAVPTENIDGFNMVKGFIFTVNPLNLSGRDLSDVANVKKAWYQENCPETATFSNVTDTSIAAHDAKTFEITQCNSDYIVSYIPANNYIYEIQQIFKGDVGFIQRYKLETQNLRDSFVLYEDLPEPDPLVNFYDILTSIYFNYPRELDSTCCEVPAPPVKGNDKATHIITLSPGGNERALGVYSYRISDYTSDFEIAAAQMEDLLRDDYKVIKGRSAPGERRLITVGNNLKAYIYDDLSWKGNDLIFVETGQRLKAQIVISYMDFPEDTLNIILNSLKVER